VREQVELLGGQVHRLVVDGHLPSGDIDAHIAE
jgi:hypothetical protein